MRKIISLCASLLVCSLLFAASQDGEARASRPRDHRRVTPSTRSARRGPRYAAGATEIKIKVVDSRGAAVAGARVLVVSQAEGDKPVAEAQTSAEGVVELHGLTVAALHIQVIALGFAPAMQEVNGADAIEIVLKVAADAQTVVVTAAGIPLVADQTGTQTATLDARQLTNMQPVALSDALRFLPGAVVTTVGQRGGQSSLFVRGGDSRYNKFIVDGVPVDDPGGTFDLGVVPVQQIDRIEFSRGPESALYGTDAITSTVQLFSAAGSTRAGSLKPELRFGADGGNFATAHGYASLAGAYRKLDYNFFGDQFNTSNDGPNADYSNSSQGANVGFAITPNVGLRFHARHSNNRTGVQSEYVFNGAQLLPPDMDQFARQNNFLSSLALNFKTPGHWQHSSTGYEYHHLRTNVDRISEPARTTPFGLQDFPFSDYADLNRAGLNYQGEWTPITWAHSTVGYTYENENGYFGDLTLVAPGTPLTHGLRRNHTLFGEQFAEWKRFTVLGGVSYVSNEYFGARVLPRATATFLAFKNTRFRGSYGQGIKEPRFEENFGIGVFGISPNTHLRAEQSRSAEVGITQGLLDNRVVLAATYYHQRFNDQITFQFDPVTFFSQYINLNRSLAHGAEVEAQARINARASLQGSYYYTSTQILSAPESFDPLQSAGSALLRRPKHAGTLLLNYSGERWGGNVSGSFIGRRPDEDFYGYNLTHAAGYALVNVGGWYKLNRFATAYMNVENALDRSYNQALGFPGLPVSVRAGMRFRVGGE